jgi:transglutaminase-like putative cysteine protease
LYPRQLRFQNVVRYDLTVEPRPLLTQPGVDYFGNRTHLVEIREPHEVLEVTSRSNVELLVRDEPDPTEYPVTWQDAAERLAKDRSLLPAVEYCFDSPLVRVHPMLASYAEPTFAKNRSLIEAVLEFKTRIFQEFKYEPLATDISTPLAQVLRERRGVCQDFAHVAVGCLRSLGLAARYVSGYLETDPPPGKPRLVGADASHAWASVFVPGFGWLDFDPTNDVLPALRHITVAWGRDFSDVSPLKGVVLGGGGHRVSVAVDVQAVFDEAPSSAPTNALA